MTKLLLILLQVEPILSVFDKYTTFGAMGLVAGTFVFLYFKERKKNNIQTEKENKRIITDAEKEKIRLLAEAEKEKIRLLADKENAEEKVEVLYNEIKVERQESQLKTAELMKKHNEIHEKTVDALIKNGEIIEKTNNTYEQFMKFFIEFKLKK